MNTLIHPATTTGAERLLRYWHEGLNNRGGHAEGWRLSDFEYRALVLGNRRMLHNQGFIFSCSPEVK